MLRILRAHRDPSRLLPGALLGILCVCNEITLNTLLGCAVSPSTCLLMLPKLC